MTRKEVYDKCLDKLYASMDDYDKGIVTCRQIIPREAIDAIIDCAVEEAVQRIRQMTFAKIDGTTGVPTAKARYVEKESTIKTIFPFRKGENNKG